MRRGWSSLKAIALQTVGCKLNQAETDFLARKFLVAGYQVVAPDQAADVYLLNTCAVTHVAEHKCRKLLRLAHRRNPDALIVAAGCYAERAPGEIQRLDAVPLAIGNGEKDRIVEIVAENMNGRAGSTHPATPGSARLRTRALVKIQEGCSQGCAFCIVPRVRGTERSRPEGDVVAEVSERVAEGCKEVVLTGTRIGRYDQGGGLGGLIERVLAGSGVQRLRLSSLEPPDLDRGLLDLWQDERVCPHIHLPLQSGSDAVLRQMGRPYTTADYERAVSLAREAIPNLALTTDVMVGFPGETVEEFSESHRFCERTGFARLHVFPYSARPGTRASRMEDTLEDGEKKRRVHMMLELARESSRRFGQRYLGQDMAVLWEGNRNGVWFGLTDNYLRVFLSSSEPLANELVATNLVTQTNDGLWGKSVIRRVRP